MASPRSTRDAAALAVLHDILRYVERELRFLDAPAQGSRFRGQDRDLDQSGNERTIRQSASLTLAPTAAITHLD